MTLGSLMLPAGKGLGCGGVGMSWEPGPPGGGRMVVPRPSAPAGGEPHPIPVAPLHGDCMHVTCHGVISLQACDSLCPGPPVLGLPHSRPPRSGCLQVGKMHTEIADPLACPHFTTGSSLRQGLSHIHSDVPSLAHGWHPIIHSYCVSIALLRNVN